MMYMNKPKIKDIVKSMYSVSDVETGYNYWFNKILNRCLSMVRYRNCPDSLPEREIALNEIITGHCVLFDHRNELRTALTELYNESKSPYYYPQGAVYAQPELGSENLKIGVNAEIVYFNSLQNNAFMIPTDSGMLTFIQRYARMLADVESTINMYTVNERNNSFPTASNDNVKASVERFFQQVELGKRAVISDNAIIEQFRNVDITAPKHDGINDWLIARDKILEQLYRDIGLKMYNPKKAQVNEEELESNDQLLVVNTADIIEQQTKDFERVNKMFGVNIIPELSPEFELKGGNADATENN